MSLTSIISKVFGTKADRDYKAVKPLLQKVLDIYPSIDSLNTMPSGHAPKSSSGSFVK